MKLRLVVPCAALAVGLVAAGCGGGGEKESEGAKTACRAAATTEPTRLPDSFPTPGEVTFTKVGKNGPTIVVDGYWSADLDKAYAGYRDHLEKAGYTILSTEKEEDDAEINYKGSGRTGQIALREDCSEDDTTRVHITSRPV